jgi:VanZ family protein
VTEAGTPALRWRGRWLAVGWVLLALVVIGSLAPLGQRGGLAGLDKVEHFLGYALLMFWFAALHAAPRRVWFAIAFVALGAALELAQGATGWRRADSLDLLADALGVAVGWIVAHRYGIAAFQHAERAAR